MKLKIFKPVTNSLRHHISIKKSILSKNNRIVKSLLSGIKNSSGRSRANGRITVRHKGGGCKKAYRKLNFNEFNYVACIISVFYDPLRTSFVSLAFDIFNKGFLYVLSTQNVGPGSLIYNNFSNELRLGCSFELIKVPSGSLVHSVSNLNKKVSFIKAAGTFGQILQKSSSSNLVRLPSGNIVKVCQKSFITVGSISNSLHSSSVIGSAGRNRRLGKRPSVRGIAMNPVDHPHGGRTNGGRPSVTPWGIPTKGKPTVKKK